MPVARARGARPAGRALIGRARAPALPWQLRVSHRCRAHRYVLRTYLLTLSTLFSLFTFTFLH